MAIRLPDFALTLMLAAATTAAQDHQIELRDGQDRTLRGARVTLRDVTGKELKLRSTVDGRLVVPEDFRIVKVVADEIEGAGREIEIDARALGNSDRTTIRVPGVQSPLSAENALRRTRDALQRASFDEVAVAWRNLRSSLLKEGITQDRLNSVDHSLDAIESTRVSVLTELGEPASIPAIEALSRMDGVESFLAQWKDLLDQLGEVSRLARTRPGSEAANRQAAFEKQFLGDESSFVAAIRDAAFTVDAPISNLAANAVDHELDGFGLGRVEIQIRFECLLLTEHGRPPARSITPAPASGLRIELQRSSCTADPEVVTIPEGHSIGTTFVISESTDGLARVVASCPGLSNVEVELPIVFPWKSILAVLIGLTSGVFLRNKITGLHSAAKLANRSGVAVDGVAAVVVLAAWFAGFVAYLSPSLPVLDPRGGLWVKFVTGAICGLVGVPFVSGWVKRWLANS